LCITQRRWWTRSRVRQRSTLWCPQWWWTKGRGRRGERGLVEGVQKLLAAEVVAGDAAGAEAAGVAVGVVGSWAALT